ncbi:hypothetical protein AAMO2058_001603800 [Amorphochlora amoebiformis]
MEGISKKWLRRVCAETEGLYETPELNDNLYLQYRFIPTIKNLEEYVNVKWLYLQNNLIQNIQNLGHMTELMGIYLGNNQISKITNLNFKQLKVINLDHNSLVSLQGIQDAPRLETLSATDNEISDMSCLGLCRHVTSVKLSRNKLGDASHVLETLRKMNQVRVLYLKGNPFVCKLKSYRNKIINTCPNLQFLDDRPVYEWERRLVKAWERGGNEEVKKERAIHKHEKETKATNAFMLWRKTQKDSKQLKAHPIKYNNPINYNEPIKSNNLSEQTESGPQIQPTAQQVEEKRKAHKEGEGKRQEEQKEEREEKKEEKVETVACNSAASRVEEGTEGHGMKISTMLEGSPGQGFQDNSEHLPVNSLQVPYQRTKRDAAFSSEIWSSLKWTPSMDTKLKSVRPKLNPNTNPNRNPHGSWIPT